jgi:hypothetical protein
VNEDNLVWQDARVRMVAAAKPVLRVLDQRYGPEGTSIEPARISEFAGQQQNVFASAVGPSRTFKMKVKQGPKQTKVQYYAKQTELEKIKAHFGRSNMSASEIGRKTFDFFLRNEVGGE